MPTVQRRRRLVLHLAALGAAGMFLGPHGWLGIDTGLIGSAVLYAALWLILIHPSNVSEEPDERDLRIQHFVSRAGSGLVALLIVANVLIGISMANSLTENGYSVVRHLLEHA